MELSVVVVEIINVLIYSGNVPIESKGDGLDHASIYLKVEISEVEVRSVVIVSNGMINIMGVQRSVTEVTVGVVIVPAI